MRTTFVSRYTTAVPKIRYPRTLSHIAKIEISGKSEEMYAHFYPKHQAARLSPSQIDEEIRTLQGVKRYLLLRSESAGTEPTLMGLVRHLWRIVKDSF